MIEALKQAGVTNISILRVKGLGLLEDPQNERYDAEFIEQSSDVVKLEIVSENAESDHYVEIIRQFAHTGNAGDGLIYLTHIERTVKIRTGEEGTL